jgi:hypothetical protein
MPLGQDGSHRIPVPEPSFNEGSHEETSRVQNLSSVAPPPLPGEAAETARDIPTFVPTQSQSQPLRILGWVMVIGGAVALALALIVPKLRSAPAPQQAAVPAPPALPAAPQPAAQAQETPPAKVEPAHSTKKERRAKRAAAAAATEAKETSIRIRARVAPVRATPDADAKVLCSVKKGAVMHSVGQRPGSKGRWFAVSCDKDSPGWVHENFVKAIQP